MFRANRSLEDFTNRLAKVPLRFHPGDAYAYGFSTDVLGRVLEVLCGKSLEEVLADSQLRLFSETREEVCIISTK